MDDAPGDVASDHHAVHRAVRQTYAEAAATAVSGVAACCGPSSDCFGQGLYGDELAEVPAVAGLASLGCGNPTAVAELAPGEVVLDLGSGGGIDVLLSAKRVGPAGLVYGLDLTPEMVRLAERNAAEAGVTNVSFIEGTIEAIPLPGGSVDVVISNCVINLSPDKAAVFTEMHRVLRPGGRVGVSDVITDEDLTDEERAERSGRVGCIAGALSRRDYESGLRAAGFEQVMVTVTHSLGEGVHSAIVRAAKP